MSADHKIKEDQGDGFRIGSDVGFIQYRPVDDTNEIWWIESRTRGGGAKLLQWMLQHHPAKYIAWGATSEAGQAFRERWHAAHPEVGDATGGAREPFEGQFDPYARDNPKKRTHMVTKRKNPAMSKFRELPVNSVFEFDHSKLSSCTSMAHGPWVKTGARTYQLALARGRPDPVHKVGSINVGVHFEAGCGHPITRRNPSMTFGRLPTRTAFQSAFKREVPDGDYRIVVKGKHTPLIESGQYSEAALWQLVKDLAEGYENGDEDAGDWASGILGTLGFEWI